MAGLTSDDLTSGTPGSGSPGTGTTGSLVTGTLASVLEADRAEINERVADARREHPTFEPQAFAAVLASVVAPLVESVEAVAGARTAEATRVLVDVALGLTAAERFTPAIRHAWLELLPAAAPFLGDDPRRVVAAITNAVDNLDRGNHRADEWIAVMTAVARALTGNASRSDAGTTIGPGTASVGELATGADAEPATDGGPDTASAPVAGDDGVGVGTLAFLDAGLVAGWRCGLAATRTAAIDRVRALAPDVLRAVLDVDAAGLDRLAADPWFDPVDRAPDQAGPDEATAVPPVGPVRSSPWPSDALGLRRVGGFRGFGGPFARPPLVAELDGNVVVTDGDGIWLAFADAFGGAIVRTDHDAVDRAVTSSGSAPTMPPGVAEVSSWVQLPHALVLTSSLTHHVLFVPASGAGG